MAEEEVSEEGMAVAETLEDTGGSKRIKKKERGASGPALFLFLD